MTVSLGITMFTLEQDAQLLELMMWRKELELAGINAYPHCIVLDERHAEILGSPTQLTGIVVEDSYGWKQSLSLVDGGWLWRTQGAAMRLPFAEGVEALGRWISTM